MGYEFLREEVEVLRLEDCGNLDNCVRKCFENVVIEVKVEDLIRLGWIPRDCVVVVKNSFKDIG